MEQERGRNIAVGLTTLGGLIGLLALLFLFGYLPRFLETGYLVEIRYNHASGLHADSPVRLNGIDVGKVESIRLNGQGGAGVAVLARIQRHVRLPAGIVPTVEAPLVGGSAAVEFVVEDMDQDTPDTVPTDGSAVIKGQVGSLASQFSQELRDAIAEPAARFDELSESFNALSTQWQAVAENLRAMTEPRDLGDVDGGRTPGNLATVLERADARLAEMETALANVNRWAGDETLRRDVQTTAANAAEASEKLNASIDRVEKRLIALADDYAKIAGTVQALADDARAGEGTVAKLLNDPALYNNLNDSAKRLQKALDEAALLIEKWKAEGVPVQF